MRVANGRTRGDERGELTSVSRSVGVSLIDYVLASPLSLIVRVLPALKTDCARVHVRTIPETAGRVKAWAQLLAEPEHAD